MFVARYFATSMPVATQPETATLEQRENKRNNGFSEGSAAIAKQDHQIQHAAMESIQISLGKSAVAEKATTVAIAVADTTVNEMKSAIAFWFRDAGPARRDYSGFECNKQ